VKRRSQRLAAHTRTAAIAAALVLLGAGAQASAAARPSLPSVERQVMCVTCKIPLNLAESPQADRERAFIQELIDSGHSEAQIKRALVSQYGSPVLALPAAHGFSLVVYLVPLALLLVLALLLALLLPRWRRRAREDALTAAPRSLAAADAARLDADMARFD
jgi:cytochrome c-type biogenesis protein CcmH